MQSYFVKKRKRKIEDIDDPLPDELYHNISKLPEPYKSLSAFLYLTGNRISEVVGIPLAEKHRYDLDSEWIVRPIRRYEIQVSEDGFFLRAKTRTLKRLGRPSHIYVCRVDTEEESRYYQLVKNWLGSVGPADYVWNVSRYKVHRYLNKAAGIPPHKLRGLRATRDAVDFELDAIDLKQKFNWRSPEMAFHYASKSSHDIERKLLRK